LWGYFANNIDNRDFVILLDIDHVHIEELNADPNLDYKIQYSDPDLYDKIRRLLG